MSDFLADIASAFRDNGFFSGNRLRRRTIRRDVASRVSRLESRTLLAANLVRDINVHPLNGGSSPRDLVDINGVTYFTAYVPGYGTEIWKSDGTSAGTVLLKDLRVGTSGSFPAYLTNVGGTLYFSANTTNYSGWQRLWKSDGTAAGTQAIETSTGYIYSPRNLVNVNGTLFFQATDFNGGPELWKIDGTTSTAVLVKNMAPGSYGSRPANLINVNGTLFFTLSDGSVDAELWKSDGTEAGTVLVRDIRPGNSGSKPSILTNVDGTLYFRANDGTNGYELWKSDGTEAGTIMVSDIASGAGSSNPSDLTNVNGIVLFRANNGTNGDELWRSDGTTTGTTLIDLVAGAGSSTPGNMINMNGTLVFSATNGINGIELWKSDGTVPGTTLVSDINAGAASSSPSNLAVVGGVLYFKADDGAKGAEFWRSDGTTSGTRMVRDIHTGTLGSSIGNVINSNGTLFFSAGDFPHGIELWKSDGTTAGTVLVSDIEAGTNGSYIRYMVNVNGTLFLTANDSVNGDELWKSDGTNAGTMLVKDIRVGPLAGKPTNLTNRNGVLYFSANDGSNGTELWKSDGTAAGTVLLKDIFAGAAGSSLTSLININGTLFFVANDGVNGVELWKSDGTGPGTVLVKDILPGNGSSNPVNLTNVNGRLYFSTNDGVNGVELWKSDGTTAGTVLVKDIWSGSSNSAPGSLVNNSGTLFFSANDGVNGPELWKSDGTAAGTVLVRNIIAGSSGSDPRYLTAVSGTLFFRIKKTENLYELWKTDGTSVGTVYLKEIRTGVDSPELTNVNGVLFFQSYDSLNGYELWKSNGTTAGTVVVANINGSGSSDPSYLRNINGILYFIANDGIHGEEVWTSNGTQQGTLLLEDVFPGPGGNLPFEGNQFGSLCQFTQAGQNVFFLARDMVTGADLWAAAGPTDVTISATSIAENNFVNDVIGMLNTVDANPTDTFTYSLVSGPGSNDNAAFNISGNKLRASAAFNFEARNTYSVRVRSVDAGGLAVEKSFTISVTNVNESPTILNLAANPIAEHNALGAMVGTFSSVDPDAGAPFTYSLVNGTGDSGNGAFSISGNELHANTIFNFESQNLYDIRVRSTDVTGMFLERTFTLEIYSVPEVPTALTISPTRFVSDIFPGTSHSDVQSLVNVSGTLFFTATDGARGRELWKSDGTSAGTVLVKDIRFGGASSNPAELTNVNGMLYFTADDGTTGRELWQSDGSAAGTVRVKDIRPGNSTSYPAYLMNMNGTLYFRATDGTQGRELWTSDGTAVGTVQVKDIRPGIFSSDPRFLTNVNGILYFSAMDGTNGDELWRSDGTAAGTMLVKDIYSGGGYSSPNVLTNVDGVLYFNANDGTLGSELWKTDGTANGTVLVKEIRAGNQGSRSAGFTSLNGVVYFVTNDAVHGYELWKTDGTPSGTTLFKDIRVGSSSGLGTSFPTNVNGVLYFSANDGTNGVELWKSDGTQAGTVLVNNIFRGSYSSYPYNFTNINGLLYFDADNGLTGRELWTSDGTAQGTRLFADIFDGYPHSSPSRPVATGEDFFFSAVSPDVGRELRVVHHPDALNLTSASIAEGNALNAAIGLFSTVDPDPGEVFSYTLVGGAGATDNALFKIIDSQLMANAVFDCETRNSYSIRVRTTGWDDLYFEQTISIFVTNVNENPSGLSLSSASITENNLPNAIVGTLVCNDPDAADLFTFSFIAGTGDTDNNSFTIDGSQLRVNSALDFETKNNYSIRVRGSDSGGLSVEQSFTIFVSNMDEAPIDLDLSSSMIAENNLSAAVIGTFSTVDTDSGNPFTYSLVNGPGDTNNNAFVVNGNQLQAKHTFDFESQSSFSIRIRTTDGTGLWLEKVFSIVIADVNEGPVALNLSATVLSENNVANAVIGQFSTVDPDPADTFTYQMVAGAGDTDNADFTISGDELRAVGTFDFETKNSYTIRVRTTDFAGLSIEAVYTITVANINDAPTALNLSSSSVTENNSIDAVIGSFTTIDPDAGSQFTYSLVMGPGSSGNAAFRILGNSLVAAETFDFEAAESYSIRVQTRDQGGLTIEQVFSIRIEDLLDGTNGRDLFVLRYTSINVAITHSINGGAAISVGTLPVSAIVKLWALQADDSVQVIGTVGNDAFFLSATSLSLNNSSIILDGPARLTLSGDSGNDVYQIDADASLGRIRLDEAPGGIDTIDLSPTTLAVKVDLGAAGRQIVNSNLSLILGSGDAFENAVGGETNDVLLGNSGNNILRGNSGNDSLDGDSGSDGLYGGMGDDNYLFAESDSAETDIVDELASEGIDILTFSSVSSSIQIDLADTSPQNVHLNRVLILRSGVTIENISGGSGNDSLRGNLLNNLLSGNAGNDVLEGMSGNDSLIGGLGDDTYLFGTASSTEEDTATEAVGAGIDTLNFSTLTTAIALNLGSTAIQSVHTNRTLKLNSGGVFESIVGGFGNDLLYGNALANTLRGNGGDDTLRDGAGHDMLFGGPGNDSYLFTTSSAAESDTVNEAANAGIDTLNFSGLTTSVTLNLGLTSMQSVHANRTLKLNSSAVMENAVGGSSNDTLYGNTLANTLRGNGGDDMLRDGAGHDWLIGGPGDDTYLFGSAASEEADAVTEAANAGVDTLSFSALKTGLTLDLGLTSIQTVHLNRTLTLNSSDVIENTVGGSGNDTIFGNTLANMLSGNGGNDTLVGGAGHDSLFGGSGDDTYIFGTASGPDVDTLTEAANAGDDTLSFSALKTGIELSLNSTAFQTVHVNRTLKLSSGGVFENAVGGSGDDILTGNAWNNTLTGNGGNDVIVGNGGNDTISGGDGRDILIGGLGIDTLLGGDNDDILIAGRTSNDALFDKLSDLRTGWISVIPYNLRPSLLRAGFGASNASLKAKVNVLNDAVPGDILTGGSGKDWHFRAIDDVITDLLASESTDVL